MDGITPVAQVQQQNPIQTLSGLMGLQKTRQEMALQRQALQTGEYTQQSAQAEAQLNQQKASELQSVGNLVKNADKYKAPDGTFDNQKFSSDVAQAAPVFGQQIANDATMRAGEVYKNKQTLLNLDQSQRSAIGDAFGAWSADTTMNHSKFVDNVEQLRDQFPNQPDVSRMLTSMATGMPSDPKGLRQALRNAAVMTNSTSAAQTNPTIGTYQGQGGVQPYQSNPQAVGGVQNIGKPLGPQGLSPTEQLGYVQAAAAAGAGGHARGGGSGSADIDKSNQVVDAQRDAKSTVDLTNRIDQLADVVRPGQLAAKVSQALGALGLQDVNQARTELEKDLGRLHGMASDKAGSDKRYEAVASGMPSATTPTETIHQAMDVTRGTARQDLSLGQLQAKSAKATKGNMDGFQQDYAHAVSSASPLMHEYNALAAQGPEAQAAFLKRNFKTKDQARAFNSQVQSVKKLSPDVLGQ